MHVELDLAARVGVTETELRLVDVRVLQRLDVAREVLADAAQQLLHGIIADAFDAAQRLTDGLTQARLGDTELEAASICRL